VDVSVRRLGRNARIPRPAGERRRDPLPHASHGSHPRELVGNWRQHSNSDKSRIGADGLSRLRQYWHQRKVISGMERIPSPKAA
jgi:hypothetical protein